MTTDKLYPLKLTPILKTKIWGGKKIQKLYRHNDPNLSNVGESWDISAMTNDDCIVENGFLAGNTLSEIVEVYMGDLVGDRIYERFGNEFPLLLKIIDANDALSIQVHPGKNDTLAPQCSGKNEMWYVLDATSEAYVIAGFNRQISREELITLIDNGKVESVVRKYPVSKGDTIFIPAGCIHSIGPGCLICEIQQPSDTTYRLYDYNRLDSSGLPRKLHIDQALDAIDYENWQNNKIIVSPLPNDVVNVVDYEYFTVNEMLLDKPQEYELSTIDSFVLLTCTEGHFTVRFDNDYLTITDGETILIPAETTSLYLNPTVPSRLLETYIKL